MHDIRLIRADGAAFDAAMARRGFGRVADAIVALDSERRAALTAQQERQARRNQLAREVGAGKRAGADTSALEAEATALRGEMEALEYDASCLEMELHDKLAALPNVLDAGVPDGADETANVEQKRWGEPRAFELDIPCDPSQAAFFIVAAIFWCISSGSCPST